MGQFGEDGGIHVRSTARKGGGAHTHTGGKSVPALHCDVHRSPRGTHQWRAYVLRAGPPIARDVEEDQRRPRLGRPGGVSERETTRFFLQRRNLSLARQLSATMGMSSSVLGPL